MILAEASNEAVLFTHRRLLHEVLEIENISAAVSLDSRAVAAMRYPDVLGFPGLRCRIPSAKALVSKRILVRKEGRRVEVPRVYPRTVLVVHVGHEGKRGAGGAMLLALCAKDLAFTTSLRDLVGFDAAFLPLILTIPVHQIVTAMGDRCPGTRLCQEPRT